jgi:putative inorganic carbon (HCO3(-)) transporter
MLLDRLGRVGAVAIAGLLAGLAIAGLIAGVGLIGVLIPVALAAGVLLVEKPWWVFGVLAVVIVLVEEDPTQGLIGQAAVLHQALPGIILSPANLVLIAMLVAVVFDVRRTGRAWRAPGLLSWPLALLALTMIGAAIVGYTNPMHDTTQLLDQIRSLLLLIIAPFAVVNLPTPPRAVRNVVIGAVIIGGLTGLEGLASYALGAGKALDAVTITFLSETPNWFTVLLILGALALVIGRGRLPWWATIASVLALVSLVLSFRRSFWIGAVVGIVFVIVAVRGGRRARLVPVVVAAAAVVLTLSTGLIGGAQGALTQRLSQLSPTAIQSSQDDRYRLDETRNVWIEIQDHPVSGLGLGVPWRVRDPLSQTFPQGSFYNHFALLWFWLHLGILGPITYLWLFGAGMVEALRVARRHRDAVVRAAGMAVAGGLVCLAVAEFTATFTGADPRFDALLGLVLGWVAWARLTETADTATPPAPAPALRSAPRIPRA